MKRNYLRPNFYLALSLLSVFLLAGCGLKDLAMGGGGDATETGNALVAGHIVMENGNSAERAEVLILPSNYNPVRDFALPDSQRALTDTKGQFHFSKLGAGLYNLQVRHNKTHTRLLIKNIGIASAKILIPVDTLRPPGSMTIPIPESLDSTSGYVYIEGTTIQVRVDSKNRQAGKIEVDSLPQAKISSVVYSSSDTKIQAIVLARDIQVVKNQITVVPPFSEWSHRANLLLNTSSSGIPLSQDLLGFPLLVRLDSPAFDFTQAQANGADIRFAKADGTQLPSEIESWDAKYGKTYLRDELEELNDKLKSHPQTTLVGFNLIIYI